MKDNNDLKEKIKSEFATPDVPFSVWAEERGLFTEHEEKSEVTCPVYELAENVGGRGVGHARKRKVAISSSVGVFLLIAVSVILAVFLPRSNNNLLPKVFGINDIVTVEAEFEEVTSQEDIYLFDLSSVVQPALITKDVLIEDNSRALLYTLYNSLLSVENGDSSDDFYLTYRIRTYQNYEFNDLNYYDDLESNVTVNDFKIDYKIVERNEVYAYAKFSYKDYEYFIEAQGFKGFTILTEDNFLNLLNKILI